MFAATLTNTHTHTHTSSAVSGGHSLHTSTQAAAPNHQRSCRKSGSYQLLQRYLIFPTRLCALVHCCSCWDLLHSQVQEAGLILRGNLRQAISHWTHTHSSSHSPVRRPCEFSHSAEEACCANSLHDWALPNKHGPVRTTRPLLKPWLVQQCVCVCVCVCVCCVCVGSVWECVYGGIRQK